MERTGCQSKKGRIRKGLGKEIHELLLKRRFRKNKKGAFTRRRAMIWGRSGVPESLSKKKEKGS